MMKISSILLYLILAPMVTFAQSLPFSEDFDNGWPAGWTQGVGPQWTVTSDGEMATTYNSASVPGPSIFLRTPTLNTTTIANPKVFFKVKANSYDSWCKPLLELAYSTNGTSFSILGQVGHANPCFSGIDIELFGTKWHYISANIPSAPAVTISFSADFIGRGRIAIDSVQVNDQFLVPAAAPVEVVRPLVFHDPVKQKLSLFKLKGSYNWRLIDLYGKTILHGRTSENTPIDIGILPHGLYLFELHDSRGKMYLREKILH